MLASCDVPSTSDRSAGAALASDHSAFAVGVGIATGTGSTVTITDAEQRQHVGLEYGSEEASQGGVLIVINYTEYNGSSLPIHAGDLTKLILIDPRGTVYQEDSGKTSAYTMEHPVDSKAWSDLNPGITVRNAEVFEVASAMFDPATWVLAIGDKDGPRISLASMIPPPVAPAPAVAMQSPPTPLEITPTPPHPAEDAEPPQVEEAAAPATVPPVSNPYPSDAPADVDLAIFRWDQERGRCRVQLAGYCASRGLELALNQRGWCRIVTTQRERWERC